MPPPKYSSFTIAKKSGGVRTIDAPVDRLKQLQRSLSSLLYDCQLEIETTRKPKRSLSHGFRKGHSILTNARPHSGRRYVFNLDLQDFFPSLNFGRVRGFFIKNQDFSLHPEVSTVIAQIACHKNYLPQGSPCSPVISNLIAHVLDVRLTQLAKKHGAQYSRYVDDITFSTNAKTFPSALAFLASPGSATWLLGQELGDEISRAGFLVNKSKTRMQYRTSLQQVTGLTVNRKVNVRAAYYRQVRTMCHSLFKKGAYHIDGSSFSSVTKLAGMVNHVYYVRTTVPTWDDQASLQNKVKKQKESERDPAVQVLYSRLLFYKYFIDLPQPLIMCEGKTDNIHLKLAIRRLASTFPILANSHLGSGRLGVDFFRHSGLPSKLLRLGGGTSPFKTWMTDFDRKSQIYQKMPDHPVIVLSDSDSGASPLINLIKNKFGHNITLSNSAPFYHLCRNLYFVLTPVASGASSSCIEDFFEQKVRDIKLGGKTFNPNDNLDSATEYGKFIFAEHVVRPNAATINFAGFSPLLARIAAACADYAQKLTSTTISVPSAGTGVTLPVAAGASP